MGNICDTCPRMQPYYPVGSCPECGTPGLMLDTKTHGVVCPVCGTEYAVSIVIPGNCDEELDWGRYTVSIKSTLSLKQLRCLARIVDESSVTLYKRAKEGTLCFEDLSYKQVFWLRSVLFPMGVEVEITPEPQEYAKFLECHGHFGNQMGEGDGKTIYEAQV